MTNTNHIDNLSVIILAAGKGTRMKSAKPKVLQTLAGKPLLAHVLDTVAQLDALQTIIIYGHGGDMVRTSMQSYNQLTWLKQDEQLGTGHAVGIALTSLPKTGKSLILYGDVPLTQLNTLKKLIHANQSGISMLTLEVDNPFGLGRIKRNHLGEIIAIIEEKDANPSEKQIREINSGIYCVDNALLHQYLPKLSNNNANAEYYLTDIIAMASQDGIHICSVAPDYAFEIDGVNDRLQLERLERLYQSHQITALQIAGVQFADRNRVDIRGNLTAGQDVFIDINTVFIGDCQLGDNVHIGAGSIIENSHIKANCTIKPYCVLNEATVGEHTSVGPFAHLRPGTILGSNVKIGNFVETKKAVIGDGSKINHLSYAGDAQIGSEVNIGAGAITCNYDGVNKSTTTIGDRAFIGSNCSLVAPIHVEDDATVGAGSTITDDVAKHTLALARSRQVSIANWQRPTKNKE